MDESAHDTMPNRPTAETLLPEIHSRLARLGVPTLARLWEGLRVRFAQEWAAYCAARGTEEAPEWEEFPLINAGDLVPLLDALNLAYAGQPASHAGAPSPSEPEEQDEAPSSMPTPAKAAGRGKAKPGARHAQSSPDRAKTQTDQEGAIRQPGLAKPSRAAKPSLALPLPFSDLSTPPTNPAPQGMHQAAGVVPGRTRRKKTGSATAGETRQLHLFDEG